MSAIDFLRPIGQALLDAFDPMRRALTSANEMDALLRREGWLPPSRDYFAPLSTALAIAGDVERVAAALDALNDGDVSIDDVQTALHAAAKLLSDLGAVKRPAGTLPSPLDRNDFWTSFPADLVQDLLITYLEKAHPVAFTPLHLLGVLDEQTEWPKAGDALRAPYQKRRVRWDRLGTMLSDPASLSRDVYGWGATFDHGKLLLRLETALRALGVLAGRHVAADELARHYFPGDPPADLRLLRATLVRERRKSGGVELGLAALPIPPASGGAPNGLFIGPIVEGAVEGEIVLDGPFSLKLAGGLESAGIVGIEMRPGQMKARLDGAAATLAMLLELSGKPPKPWILVGDESSERVELADFTLGLELDGAATDPELKLRLHTGALRLVIDPSGGDSFLQRIFGSEPQTLQASGDLVWSSKSGLRFEGQAGLQLVVPINATFGPTNVRQLTVGVETKGQAVELTAGVTGHGGLGPVDLAVENVGLALSLTPVQPPARGVFGDLDLSFGFHPPTGVGLSVDTSAVQGAGFLLHDPAKYLYAGALQLTVRDRFGLEIAGLLTTRMPDGSAGYSLLLLGTLQFPPIPIGFGFSIDKLGVLVGINRTADVDAMTGALAAGDLDAVLFPRNPAAMASVPDGLGKLFPPKQDAHTIGILAGFTWGPSALAQIELGVIYDTSAPARIVAIGRLTIERPQISLHVLALGVLDFDKGEIDLQARLVGSRILGGDLDGDAAIMARWGDNPDLVLSIGGFHPAYQPPTEFTRRFAALRRVSFRAHTDESVLRLGLQAYLAVTSSTVQMGARVDFGVTVSAFSVDGMLSFDALIQWDPELYIDVMVRGTVALKVGGATLFGASIAAQLIGPGDWYVTGKATVSVLWWDVHVGFTIGDKPARPELPAVDGASQLAAALADPRSWGTQASANGLVFVRRASAPGGALVFHPLDELTVRQQIVPLGTRVDRIDAGPLTAPRTFEVAVKVGGRPMATEALSDAFARAKYVVMSDAARLSAPSFEQMRSGVRVNLDAPAVSAPSVVADWTYQPFVLTAQGLQSPAPPPFVPTATAETRALAGSVAGGGLS